MLRSRITRRGVLRLGAAAFAAGLAPSAPALAAPAGLFELSLDGDLGDDSAGAAGWRTTPVLTAPRRFDLLGLRWGRGGQLQAQVRTRRARGAWSAWTDLHAAGGHAPDSERVPGTEPVFTGPADILQLRLRGSARDVRVRFVRAQPAARTARALTPGAKAAQSGLPVAVTPRAGWGADAVPPRAAPAYGQVQLAFVHHTATSSDYRPEDSPGIVLGICRYHRDSNKWNDIGYNFLVDKYGQVFEGRAGGIDRAVIGAQAQGYNAVSTGIACIGDFSTIAQSPAAMEALARLIGWKLSIHGVPVTGQVSVSSAGGSTNRFTAGAAVTFERISGHRDGNNTSCPGGQLYAQLPRLRARAAVHATATATSTLSLRVEDGDIRHPAAARVAGAMSLVDAAPVAGLWLTIELQPSGSPAWEPVGVAQVGGDGSWSASVPVDRSGALRAVWAGDGARPALSSPAAPISVASRLSTRLSTRRLPAGGVFTVEGEVAPPPPGGRVALTLERRRGSTWVPVRRRRVSVRGGSYSVRLRVPVRGLYRVTVSAPGATRKRRLRATKA